MRRAILLAVLSSLLAGPAAAQTPPVIGRAFGAGGVSIYYEIIGAGRDTILFLHGTPSTMYSLARDFDGLARDFTLIFFDQRGGGRSQQVLNPDSLRWQDHVADIEALRLHLRIGRMHLLGVSWGSALVALYASAYPERVGRIVVFPMRATSKAEVPSEPETLAPALDSLERARVDFLLQAWRTASDPRPICAEYWRLQERSMFFDPIRARAMRGSFCDEPPEVLRNTWIVSDARVRSLGGYDLRPQLQAIKAPTLVAKGVRTRMYHVWTEDWVRALPDARLFWVEKAGNFPWVERPDVVTPALREFFAGRWPAGSLTVR